MAIDDTTILDDALSRVLALAYIKASEMNDDMDTGRVNRMLMDEGLLRAYLFGTDEQYERACRESGSRLKRNQLH